MNSFTIMRQRTLVEMFSDETITVNAILYTRALNKKDQELTKKIFI